MVSEKEFLDIYFKSYGRDAAYIGYKTKGIPIKQMKLYKGLTSLVNYHCKDGCASHGVTEKGIGKCCCGSCKKNVGYLHNILYEDVTVYAKSFGKDGFWTETGCVLPRELRSSMCLTECCHTEKLTLSESNLIDIIRNGKEASDSYLRVYNSSIYKPSISYDGIANHLKERLMGRN